MGGGGGGLNVPKGAREAQGRAEGAVDGVAAQRPAAEALPARLFGSAFAAIG